MADFHTKSMDLYQQADESLRNATAMLEFIHQMQEWRAKAEELQKDLNEADEAIANLNERLNESEAERKEWLREYRAAKDEAANYLQQIVELQATSKRQKMMIVALKSGDNQQAGE